MADLEAFETVEKRSLSDAVFDQLRARILSGDFDAGSELPSERRLCEALGVNRGALREALKRLQQLRLVSIRQGEATKVLDFRRTGGLELLASMLFDERGGIAIDVVRSLVEMRTALGPDIARLAAERRTDADLVKLDAAHEALVACPEGDAIGRQRLSLELWRVLVNASGNIAYQLAFNTMEQGWTRVQDVVAAALLPETSHTAGYEQIVRAVRSGRAETARRAAARLVSRGARALSELLDVMEGTP